MSERLKGRLSIAFLSQLGTTHLNVVCWSREEAASLSYGKTQEGNKYGTELHLICFLDQVYLHQLQPEPKWKNQYHKQQQSI